MRQGEMQARLSAWSRSAFAKGITEPSYAHPFQHAGTSPISAPIHPAIEVADRQAIDSASNNSSSSSPAFHPAARRIAANRSSRTSRTKSPLVTTRKCNG